MLDDGFPTDTSREQWALESKVTELYSDLDILLMHGDHSALRLEKSKHAAFLKRGLGHLHKGGRLGLAGGTRPHAIARLVIPHWARSVRGRGHFSLPVFGAPREKACTTLNLPPPRCRRTGFASLDASRAWICYWIVHGLKLLGEPVQDPADREAVIAFISTCQQKSGGFGGGPYQLAHLAPTYAGTGRGRKEGGEGKACPRSREKGGQPARDAGVSAGQLSSRKSHRFSLPTAVATLVTLGGEDALETVDRAALMDYFLRMAVPPDGGGGMIMHEGGLAC